MGTASVSSLPTVGQTTEGQGRVWLFSREFAVRSIIELYLKFPALAFGSTGPVGETEPGERPRRSQPVLSHRIGMKLGKQFDSSAGLFLKFIVVFPAGPVNAYISNY